MKKTEDHKKVPLSDSPENATDIETKVDQILDAHAYVQRQKNKQGTFVNRGPSEKKPPQFLFYVHDKKKTEPLKKPGTENKSLDAAAPFYQRNNQQKDKRTENHGKNQKPALVKKKKHIGFKKTEKTEKVQIKPSEGKKEEDSPDVLPHFEESIAQVKEDEAAWLDNKIRASTTPKDSVATVSSTTETTDVLPVIVNEASTSIPETQPQGSASETNAQEVSHFKEVTTSSINQSSPGEASVQQVVVPSDQDANKTEVKLEEIIPDGKIQFQKEANQLKGATLERMGYSEDQIEEIDFYPIYEPFSYVEIIREKESLDKRYILLEMQLTKDEEYLLKFVQETLDSFAFKTVDLEAKGEGKYLSEKVDLILDDYMLNIDSLTKKKLLYYLEKESIGLGKLESIMKDPNIEDISCDGSGVFIFLYHRRYGSLKSNVQFNEEDELTAFVVKLAQKCGKHISISEPMLDATMPDGSRIQMTLSTEVTTKGSTFTIRKFSEDPFSPPDLVEFHTMSSEMVAYMWLAVENGINALIAGGTAAGKTSTLNALCLFIPRESKIVTIEETREINLPHPNWIPGVVRSGFGEVVGNKVIGEIDLYDLMKAALRQRPEYILVGEIRGKEAYVLFQAMATGHTTYSTVHADSAQSLIHRLEGKPIEIPRIMLQTLDIVIIQVISRVKNKRARRCKQIIEIIDIDPTTKEILTNEVFRWDPIEDKFVYSGKSYVLERIRAEKDISREGMISEIKNRTTLLDWMNKNNIREFKKVATIVAQYMDNPTEVMKKIRNQ